MLDLEKLKELAERCNSVQKRLAEPEGSVGFVLAHTAHQDYFEAITPRAALKLIEVIRVQSEALERLSGFEAARLCLLKTKEILGEE